MPQNLCWSPGKRPGKAVLPQWVQRNRGEGVTRGEKCYQGTDEWKGLETSPPQSPKVSAMSIELMRRETHGCKSLGWHRNIVDFADK